MVSVTSVKVNVSLEDFVANPPDHMEWNADARPSLTPLQPVLLLEAIA